MVLSFLHIQKKQIRHEVKDLILKGLDKEELVLLKFSREIHASLHWEKEFEFEYKGEMYDVVEQEFRGDSIFYWCWWDKEETELNKKRSEYTAQILGQDQERNQRQEQLIQFYKQLFFERANVNSNYQELIVEDIPHVNPIYHRPFIAMSNPPPIQPFQNI